MMIQLLLGFNNDFHNNGIEGGKKSCAIPKFRTCTLKKKKTLIKKNYQKNLANFIYMSLFM